MKTIAIIQARMSSSRLPGKALLPLNGKPVLWWIATRCLHAKLVDGVVIATTDSKANIPIACGDYLPPGAIATFSFIDEDDVLGRVLAAASTASADVIIDITGDCPCVDPRHIDRLISILINNPDLDYASNCVERNWPDGLDVQVYKTEALMKVREIFDPPQHVGWNIAQHPEFFEIAHWTPNSNMHWPELGLTLDTPQDYALLHLIFERFGHDPAFKTEDVVIFLRKNPQLVEINEGVRRKTSDEG